jgi:two-component system, OmpR family, phosphate regulon response regulator OmpR
METRLDMTEKILVVDDDPKLQRLLGEYLAGYGFQVRAHGRGDGVAEVIAEYQPNLVVLDIMLPGQDGLSVLGQLRAGMRLPIIMLTAKGDDADRIVGLELGADDYLPKPFNPRELLARIRAVLRRAAGPEETQTEGSEPEMISAAGLRLDTGRQALWVEETEIELSATEYKIMRALMGRPGVVFTRDQLLGLSRGRDLEPYDRSVDVHISNLRAKLKPFPALHGVIKTAWGAGYMLVDAR